LYIFEFDPWLDRMLNEVFNVDFVWINFVVIKLTCAVRICV